MHIEVLPDSPIAEFVKQDESSVITVDLLEGGFRVLHVNTPFGQNWDGKFKLILTDPSVVACIYSTEGSPVLIILFEIEQQVFELCLGNVIISMRVCGFEFILGHLEGSHDYWLKLEELWNLDDISEPLVHFSQAQVTIAIHVKGGPIVVTSLNIGLAIA